MKEEEDKKTDVDPKKSKTKIGKDEEAKKEPLTEEEIKKNEEM